MNSTPTQTHNELVLIRGLPGSGKTTMAKQMTGHVNFEADMYFMQDGKYHFVPEMIPNAHAWCLEQTKKALLGGKSVVVSNTFTRKLEIEPYLELGFPVRILEATGSWPNTHAVSDKQIEVMRNRWEIFDI